MKEKEPIVRRFFIPDKEERKELKQMKSWIKGLGIFILLAIIIVSLSFLENPLRGLVSGTIFVITGISMLVIQNKRNQTSPSLKSKLNRYRFNIWITGVAFIILGLILIFGSFISS